jgi:hypothetical protein
VDSVLLSGRLANKNKHNQQQPQIKVSGDIILLEKQVVNLITEKEEKLPTTTEEKDDYDFNTYN